jgi:hypothetical protein
MLALGLHLSIFSAYSVAIRTQSTRNLGFIPSAIVRAHPDNYLAVCSLPR